MNYLVSLESDEMILLLSSSLSSSESLQVELDSDL